jgi:hypothetical protein
MKFEFSGQIFGKIYDLMNIRPVGAEWFHADRQTDTRTDETNSRFVQFCERA